MKKLTFAFFAIAFFAICSAFATQKFDPVKYKKVGVEFLLVPGDQILGEDYFCTLQSPTCTYTRSGSGTMSDPFVYTAFQVGVYSE